MLKVGFRLPEPWNHLPQDIAGHCGNDVKPKHDQLVLVLLSACKICKEESHEDDAKDEEKGREGGLSQRMFSTSWIMDGWGIICVYLACASSDTIVPIASKSSIFLNDDHESFSSP